MRDKTAAGFLALFTGYLGVHRFYLGQVGMGILYFLLMFTGISFVLGIIDAIVFFTMDQDRFDIKYNPQLFERKMDVDFYRNTQNYREQRQAPQRRETTQQSQQSRTKQAPPTRGKQNATLKTSGVEKYKDFDYEGAITDFEKALEANPRDVAVHFNLACAYSLMENTEKSLFHLDKAVGFGFSDGKRIKEHDALAFVRVQPQFETFEQNGFRLAPQLAEPKADDLLSTAPNLLEQLKRLGELRERGLLTEDEFSMQKKKLLG
ncbi:MAG: NINE protein [Saprospiraceae bacterium]|nr:NINE protein [Saprospiraceae bacterium]MDZ4702334.1 NINE protein [Saprospiraceae bacterium]